MSQISAFFIHVHFHFSFKGLFFSVEVTIGMCNGSSEKCTFETLIVCIFLSNTRIIYPVFHFLFGGVEILSHIKKRN